MKITYNKSNEHHYPNMMVYERIKDGAVFGWKIEANEGYKLYNPKAIEKTFNPITMEEETNITYLSMVMLPSKYNWEAFSYEAVEVTE